MAPPPDEHPQAREASVAPSFPHPPPRVADAQSSTCGRCPSRAGISNSRCGRRCIWYSGKVATCPRVPSRATRRDTRQRGQPSRGSARYFSSMAETSQGDGRRRIGEAPCFPTSRRCGPFVGIENPRGPTRGCERRVSPDASTPKKSPVTRKVSSGSAGRVPSR